MVTTLFFIILRRDVSVNVSGDSARLMEWVRGCEELYRVCDPAQDHGRAGAGHRCGGDGFAIGLARRRGGGTIARAG